ncbi:hypothetical protein NA56DRAFT_345005 [Hyaloscypha hepaticicola]|uniref:Secreted protein n=1 Tax=Hyaloscypha hepaticicola TaxID=2082293 RepID=A0A2J6QJI1_9HELO|nr:hypothetical protein NA56DRAFT_345005 [Hyaloscypha hepaticicola]
MKATALMSLIAPHCFLVVCLQSDSGYSSVSMSISTCSSSIISGWSFEIFEARSSTIRRLKISLHRFSSHISKNINLAFMFMFKKLLCF